MMLKFYFFSTISKAAGVEVSNSTIIINNSTITNTTNATGGKLY